MKICVAQTRPVKGDIPVNIRSHQKLIELAVAEAADLIIFPELSLTGYEPSLAQSLAWHPNDNDFANFQTHCARHHISIGVGMPMYVDAGIAIGMMIFQPGVPLQPYFKQHLHPDEYPFFVAGPPKAPLIANHIAVAICYELSVPEHSETAYKQEAKIYIASVAKTKSGVEKAYESLTAIALKYQMTVLMSNSVGPSDDFIAAGQTGIWDSNGLLLNQLDSEHEGILVLDTVSQTTIKKHLF
jgi:predicted amidohydrolase